jgi:hypothetical protein
MPSDKVPGPDDFTSAFLKACCNHQRWCHGGLKYSVLDEFTWVWDA